MTDTAGPVQVTQAEADRALKWINHNLMLAKGLMKSSSEAGNGAENFRAHDAHQALTVAKNAIMAWNTRAASNGEGAEVDLAAQLERLGDDYAEGKTFYGEKMNAAAIAASCFYQAAELVKRHVASSNFCALAEGLHAQIFGVHSLADPALSHAALADGGQIHEAAHALIRSLPASLNPSQDGESSTASSVDRLVAASNAVLAAIDDYNEKNGTALGGPAFFELGRAIASLANTPAASSVGADELRAMLEKARRAMSCYRCGGRGCVTTGNDELDECPACHGEDHPTDLMREIDAALAASSHPSISDAPGVNCPDCGGRIATACPHCGAEPVNLDDFPVPASAGDGLIALRAAVSELLKHRVGGLPGQGWLRDNDTSRAALARLADLVR